jgi:hypothetical protein
MRGIGLCPRILTTLVWSFVRAEGLALALAGVTGMGCGDPPLCQSDVFVAFQQTMISTDVDAATPGVQTDVHLRTSLQAGDVVTLEVLGEDGTQVEAIEAPVADDGSVVFTGVSVSGPRVFLRATGRGTCGVGRDEIAVDVLPGAGCTVHVTSPTAPVTRDADDTSANGSQVDVALAVGPACVGRTVTSRCGASSPSGVVQSDGSVALRTNICVTSPCQAEVDCTFRVIDAIGVETRADVTIVFDDQPPVTDFTAAAKGRQHIQLTWTAPDHWVLGGPPPVAYLLKNSSMPLSNANFDGTGTVLMTAAPAAPGSLETLDVVSLSSGMPQYFAIAMLDGAGHRSAVALAGPVVPK